MACAPQLAAFTHVIRPLIFGLWHGKLLHIPIQHATNHQYFKNEHVVISLYITHTPTHALFVRAYYFAQNFVMELKMKTLYRMENRYLWWNQKRNLYTGMENRYLGWNQKRNLYTEWKTNICNGIDKSIFCSKMKNGYFLMR